jgi:hypothetical protein
MDLRGPAPLELNKVRRRRRAPAIYDTFMQGVMLDAPRTA